MMNVISILYLYTTSGSALLSLLRNEQHLNISEPDMLRSYPGGTERTRGKFNIAVYVNYEEKRNTKLNIQQDLRQRGVHRQRQTSEEHAFTHEIAKNTLQHQEVKKVTTTRNLKKGNQVPPVTSGAYLTVSLSASS